MKGKVILLFLIFSIAFFLSSCSTQISKANYDKVKIGMSIPEVITILGKPSSSSTLSMGNNIATSATWKSYNRLISIQFFNDHVKVKKYIEGVSTSRDA